MLVSSSEGFARDGLLAAILLRALMIVVVERNWGTFSGCVTILANANVCSSLVDVPTSSGLGPTGQNVTIPFSTGRIRTKLNPSVE
jgi:hypothetical protein